MDKLSTLSALVPRMFPLYLHVINMSKAKGFVEVVVGGLAVAVGGQLVPEMMNGSSGTDAVPDGDDQNGDIPNDDELYDDEEYP